MLKTFLINLDRRPDRFAAMQETLDGQGVPFERIVAEDGAAYPPALAGQSMTNAEVACHRSHRAAWQRLVDSHEHFALVLEDDVLVSPSFRELIGRSGWLPGSADIVRLEASTSDGFLSLQSTPLPGGARMYKVVTPRDLTAAYVIGRDAALALLASDPSTELPVDTYLKQFIKPDGSPLAIYQVSPAPCVQGKIYHGETSLPPLMESDIESERAPRLAKISARTPPRKARFQFVPTAIKEWLRPVYHRYVLRVRSGPIAFDGPPPGADRG